MADPDLKTIVDRELGPAVKNGTDRVAAKQQARTMAVPAQLEPPQAPSSTTYGVLSQRNPEWLGDYWHLCRALYAGGPRLLRDDAAMKALFPSHIGEVAAIYAQRRERAFYVAYAGEIIDHLLAGFAADPIRLATSTEEKPLDEWWSDFADDVSPPGAKKQPLSSFAVDCLREAFITQSAWVLVDLPSSDPDEEPPADRLEEEQRGLLDPYLSMMPSHHVVDWECDEGTGELKWVLVHWTLRQRENLRASRSQITERWMYWDREHWERYELTYTDASAPRPETPVQMVSQGPHPFKVVPFVRLQLPDGLYAMGKLESIAREHFNKRNAVGWAEYKALFSVLYEFLSPPPSGAFTPSGGKDLDPNRAANQVRGQGWTQVRAQNDDARYIGPDVAPFKEARESCAELMREMHRVMFSMALSANMDSAALQRSGDSKAKDAAQIAAILAKVGELLRESFDAVVELVSRVRAGGKDAKSDVHTTGGEKFDADSIADSISEATDLTAGVPMKSATFLKRYLFRLYKLALGAGATTDDLEDIRKELEDAVTPESMMLADAMPMPNIGGEDKPSASGGDDLPNDEEEDDEPPPKPQPAPARRQRRMFPAS